MSVPVYLQVVFGLSLFTLIFAPLERKFPLRRQRLFRVGWATDVTYFVVGCFGGVLSSGASVTGMLIIRRITGMHHPDTVSRQPGWLQFLEILIMADFLGYLFHRLLHETSWLWRFHRIHHSAEEMDWLVNVRVHPVDKILGDCFQFIPILCLGFADLPLLAYTGFLGFQGFLNHANVRLNYGPLRWIIVGPQFHHWHHCSNEFAQHKNFAPHLVVFDLLFGTALIPPPHVMPEAYGVSEMVPKGFLAQMICPFRP